MMCLEEIFHAAFLLMSNNKSPASEAVQSCLFQIDIQYIGRQDAMLAERRRSRER